MDIVASLVAAAFGIVCFTQVIRSLRSGVLKGRLRRFTERDSPSVSSLAFGLLASAGLFCSQSLLYLDFDNSTVGRYLQTFRF